MVELWCPEVWAHVTSEFPVLFNAAFPNSKKCPIFTLNWEFAGGGLVGGWISLYYLALGKIDLAICKSQFFYLSLAGWWFASSWEKSFWEHLADVTQSLDISMATAKVRAGTICHNLLWHLARVWWFALSVTYCCSILPLAMERRWVMDGGPMLWIVPKCWLPPGTMIAYQLPSNGNTLCALLPSNSRLCSPMPYRQVAVNAPLTRF